MSPSVSFLVSPHQFLGQSLVVVRLKKLILVLFVFGLVFGFGTDCGAAEIIRNDEDEITGKIEFPTDTVGAPCNRFCTVFEDKSDAVMTSVTIWHGGSLQNTTFEALEVHFLGEQSARPLRGRVYNHQTRSVLTLSPDHGEEIRSMCGTTAPDVGTIKWLNITTTSNNSLSLGDPNAVGRGFCFDDGPIAGFHGQIGATSLRVGKNIMDRWAVQTLGVVYKHNQHIAHVPAPPWHKVFWAVKSDRAGVASGWCRDVACPAAIADVSGLPVDQDESQLQTIITNATDRMFGRIFYSDPSIFYDVAVREDGARIRKIILHSRGFLMGLSISEKGLSRILPLRGFHLRREAEAEQSSLSLSRNVRADMKAQREMDQVKHEQELEAARVAADEREREVLQKSAAQTTVYRNQALKLQQAWDARKEADEAARQQMAASAGYGHWGGVPSSNGGWNAGAS